MEVQVLGVSGSPVPDSNTDRAVKLVLNHTGLRTRFVKLSELRLEPCRGCLGCVENNQCTVDDDGRSLAEAFRTASAFVLGAFTPYNSLDARSKMFMERMYCLRHQTGRNSGKFGAYVITTACPPYGSNVPPAFETATSQIRSWMAEEGILEIGGMLVVGNVPCIRCGHGDACMVSGIKLIHGSEATIASVGIQRFEDDPLAEDNAKQLALQVRRAVLGNLDAPAG
jgi:multimeric flavodoxin WrbA